MKVRTLTLENLELKNTILQLQNTILQLQNTNLKLQHHVQNENDVFDS